MTKQLITIFVAIVFISCVRNNEEKSKKPKSSNAVELSVRENLKIKEGFEKNSVEILKNFFSTKNENLYQNKYWSKTDFQKYTAPYYDIFKIEKNDSMQNYYQPQLIEIVDTHINNQKLFKIAFIGKDRNQPKIKSIYNILVADENGIILKRPLNLMTKDWEKQNIGSVKYVISPYRKLNQLDVKKQLKIERLLTSYFDLEPIEITFYSCISPKEIFEIKGFDYNPMMYVSKTGGFAEKNMIFSGNNSEFYAHELIHIYSNKRFPHIPLLLDEGFAMLIGGSGVSEYEFHRENLKEYLEENTELNFSDFIEPYQRMYINEETSVPYMVGALLCEVILKEYGKEKLFEFFQGNENLWKNLNSIGITKKNLDYKLKFALKNYVQHRLTANSG